MYNQQAMARRERSVMTRIRKFRPSDTPDVARLIAETFATYNHREGTRRAIRSYISFYHANPQALRDYFSRAPIHFVAVQGSKVVGVVRGRSDCLTGLFVAGSHHRRGIGSRLVKMFERQARRMGASAIRIRAALYAVSFYSAVGFKKTTGVRGFKGLRIQPMKKMLLGGNWPKKAKTESPGMTRHGCRS